MKLSLFTPTHRPTHLLELYDSLLKQTCKVDWEWLIVPNATVTITDIPDVIRADPHVRILFSNLSGIGALKRFCCENLYGHVFIEMDHDDQLCHTAFDELVKAYQKEPTGFYYSDFVNVKPDGTCETYGTNFGWESYPCNVNGNLYTACRAFEPTARSICQIYYAPNHVRAWSRSAYEASGGHDPEMTVGDDHDLVCRTYLAEVPFVWIKKPIYLYRRYSENTFVKQNKKIQQQQTANCEKYLHQLIYEEGRRSGLRMVNLGPVDLCPEGLESCPDGLLYSEDSSIACIRMNDYLQMLPASAITSFFNNCHKALMPGGWIISSTPSIDDGKGGVGRGAYQNPEHKSYWSENNFGYFTDSKYRRFLPGVTAKFQSMVLKTDYPSPWHEENKIPYVHATLSALKGQRQPGPKKF